MRAYVCTLVKYFVVESSTEYVCIVCPAMEPPLAKRFRVGLMPGGTHHCNEVGSPSLKPTNVSGFSESDGPTE